MIGHINVYSCYSFHRSTILIEQLCKRASELHLEALALTDENNMFGALEFYHCAKKHNIKPIIGVEASVLYNDEEHLFTLLAKDNTGYHDLIKIVSDISLSDNHAIDIQALSVYKEHLYIIASRKNIIYRQVALHEYDNAREYLRFFKQLFGDNFYLALINHMEAVSSDTNDTLMITAKEANVKVCASNDVRYLQSNDAVALDLLEATKDNLELTSIDPINKQKYLKSSYEMSSLFKREVVDNTNHILRSCNVTIEEDKHIPVFPIPKGTSFEYLTQLCKVGLKKRFDGKQVPTNYIERLKKELTVINKMGFNDYFLIVFDYVRWAKKQKILVGPGRGSAAGSLVSYVLGITNVDPIKYDLLFERFLNEERVSMPDIDIDFQDDRRDEVVDYVTNKYGKDYAAQIVTFTTFGPRNALKELGAVIGGKPATLERIAKDIPIIGKSRKTVKEVYENSYNFSRNVASVPNLDKIIPAISLVEHLPKNISVHAAGVVISDKPLNTVVPLTLSPTGSVVTQYSKDYIEEVGLLKMDFLGLKNLTIINKVINSVDEDININDIPLDDPKVFEMLSRGDTFGIFQLESNGMTSLIRQMKCSSIDDIVAALALYRPGPMKNIPLYIKRKFKQEPVVYPLECLEDVLKNTYGILIYQEQIMQVAQIVGGFSLAKADTLRKAMSKKNRQMISSMQVEFINGALINGFTKEQGQEIYELIERFADYGYNKAHSVAYGMISYQLAYLKAHYPLQFYCALLSNDRSSEQNKLKCIQECKKLGIKILPPSINSSNKDFAVEGNNIRYSLLAIKGIGLAGYQAIEKGRQDDLYKDIYDFYNRVNNNISKAMYENLISAGALDEFDKNRLNLISNFESDYRYATTYAGLVDSDEPIRVIVPELKNEILQREKNVLGVYLSNHPLALIKAKYDKIVDINRVHDYIDKYVKVIISITRVKTIKDRKGQDMCFIEGSDDTGSIEGVVFGSTYPRIKDSIVRGETLIIEGKINYRDKLSLVVNDAKKV